jgi:hypothetical protein
MSEQQGTKVAKTVGGIEVPRTVKKEKESKPGFMPPPAWDELKKVTHPTQEPIKATPVESEMTIFKSDPDMPGFKAFSNHRRKRTTLERAYRPR